MRQRGELGQEGVSRGGGHDLVDGGRRRQIREVGGGGRRGLSAPGEPRDDDGATEVHRCQVSRRCARPKKWKKLRGWIVVLPGIREPNSLWASRRASGGPTGSRRRRFATCTRSTLPSYGGRCVGSGWRRTKWPTRRQEVFVVVHRRLRSFEGRSALRTWLFQIARHVAQHHHRSEQRRDRRIAALAERDADRVEASSRLEAPPALHLLLGRLDEDKRHAFVLARLEGMTDEGGGARARPQGAHRVLALAGRSPAARAAGGGKIGGR